MNSVTQGFRETTLYLTKEFKEFKEDMNKQLSEFKKNNTFLSECKPIDTNLSTPKMCLCCVNEVKIKVLPPWRTFIISKSRFVLSASLPSPSIFSCLSSTCCMSGNMHLPHSCLVSLSLQLCFCAPWVSACPQQRVFALYSVNSIESITWENEWRTLYRSLEQGFPRELDFPD